MALLSAALDPAVRFADLNASTDAQNWSLASSQRMSSTQATISLDSRSGGSGDGIPTPSDCTLTISGMNLSGSLSGIDALFASIAKASLVRRSDPSNILLSWDGQGGSVPLPDLGSTVGSGDRVAVLHLLLSGVDALNSKDENVDISGLGKSESIMFVGPAQIAAGNNVANAIQGSAFDRAIACLGGDDVARGLAGKDALIGGAGYGEICGDFGRNQCLGNKDLRPDLLVVKSDRLMFNQLINGIDNANAETCGLIDNVDKIIIQGCATAQLSFQGSYAWQGPVGVAGGGIAILAAGTLEALGTGGDFTLAQLQGITSGDGSFEAVNSRRGLYGTGDGAGAALQPRAAQAGLPGVCRAGRLLPRPPVSPGAGPGASLACSVGPAGLPAAPAAAGSMRAEESPLALRTLPGRRWRMASR